MEFMTFPEISSRAGRGLHNSGAYTVCAYRTYGDAPDDLEKRERKSLTTVSNLLHSKSG